MRQAFTNESASSSMPPTNRARLFTSQSSILLLKPHAHTVPHPPSLNANLVRTQPEPASSGIQEKRYAEPSRTSYSILFVSVTTVHLSLSLVSFLFRQIPPPFMTTPHTHTQRDQQPLPTTTTTTTTTMKGLLLLLLRPTRPRLDATHTRTHTPPDIHLASRSRGQVSPDSHNPVTQNTPIHILTHPPVSTLHLLSLSQCNPFSSLVVHLSVQSLFTSLPSLDLLRIAAPPFSNRPSFGPLHLLAVSVALFLTLLFMLSLFHTVLSSLFFSQLPVPGVWCWSSCSPLLVL